MGIRLVSGRTFADADSADRAPVIIVNRALARAAFPNDDVLGQMLVIGDGYLTDARDLRPRTIVGIVGDTREQGLRFAPTMAMYVPVAQAPEIITRLILDKIPLRWVIRTDREPADVVPAVRRAALAVDPAQPAADFASMSDVLARSIAPARFNMVMLTIFGALAVVLAGPQDREDAGCWREDRDLELRPRRGTLGGRRTRHDHVRREALMQRSGVRHPSTRLAWHGARLSLAGTIAGVGGSLLLARFLRTLLFGVGASDGLTIAIVAALMTVVVTIATYLPASRATAIDPMIALRHD